MALFPAGPTNGQTTVVNGITYTYNSAQTAWIRTNSYPIGDLNVGGNLAATGNISGLRLISNVATGTAPLTVSSTTVVSNLNADLLDGFNTATANTASTVAVRDANGNLSANFFTGNGSQLTGIITSVSNVSNGNSNLNIPSANGNVNISAVGNANILIVTGTGVNVAGTLNTGSGVITGNGSGLSAIAGANITGQVANALVAGTVYTAAQPNITSVGTLTSLGVTGTTTSGNFATAGNITASFLVSNIATGTAPLTVTSTTRVNNLNVAYANVADNINVVAGTGNNFIIFANAATGNISEVTSTGLTANLSNNSITATTFVGALSGAATTAGTVTTAAQPNITSVGTLTSLGVSGTVTASTLVSNVATGTAPLTVTSTTTVANLAAATATTAGTVTTNAQPNITSTGTLTSLTVTGNATVGNIISSGTGGNISGANVISANTITATGNGTFGNINTSGTETATRFISNIATGTAPLTVTSTTRVANLSVDYANVADFITVAAGTGNNFLIFANAATGNVAEITSTGLTANLSNNSITATTFVGALSGAATSATTAGTVTTAAQGNITSVGTLTGLGVNGTVTAVNITANTGVFTGNANGISSVQAGNIVGTTLGATVVTSSLTSVGTLGSLTVTGNVAAGNLTTTGVLSVTGTGVSSIGGNLDMTSNTIINLASPTNSTDAATKQYVDDVAQGLHTHDSCNAATQTTLAIISAGTVTYNNGTAGVGANLTTTGSFTTIDGVTLSNGMRILVKNEANTAHNGIYDRTSTTVLTRSTDFDTPTEMAGGDFTFVTAGTLYDNTGWVMPDPVTTVGTTAVVWVQFSGAGTYTAGTGLTLTGSQFSVNVAQSQITSVGTLTSLGVSGAVTASTLTSNVATGTAPFTVTSTTQVANLSVATAGSATTAGTVTTAAQPNITSTGTLTSLAVTGNITAGNVNTSGTETATRFISNIATGTAPLTVTSTTRVANLSVDYANVSDFITVAAGTGNNFIIFANAATGNVTELTSTGLIANLSNNSITATTFVGALSGAATSATTAGTVTTAAQPNITSLGTLANLTVTGNVALSGANVSLGAVGNLKITGGTANQVLRSDGGGAVSWQTLPVTNIQEFTATAAQTTFTVSGTYIVGSVLVFVNGIQMNNVDYTATNGTTVVLTEARVAGDTVRVVSSVGSVGLNNMQAVSVAMSVALGM
jgi:hypothetical protein